MALMTLLPLILLILTSFKSMNDIIANGPLSLPAKWEWSNISEAWQKGNFAVYYKNTIIITAFTVGLIVCCTMLTAYVIHFLKFPGKRVLMLLLVIGLIAPVELLIIPLFYLLKDLNMLNTYIGIILPKTALYMPFGTFLLIGFIRSLPHGVIESARIDGAREARILYSVVAPMIQPAVMTLMLFASLSTWNSFLMPTVLLQRDDMRMVSTGLSYFQDLLYVEYPLLMAGALIIAAPMIILYFFLHRRMIEAITSGSMKG